MRRFEFEDDSSKTFWEIAVDGSSHTVRFGRIGATGQTKTKEFASEAAAKADADKLVREKLGKGYREIAAAPPAKGTKTTLKAPPGHAPFVFLLAGTKLVTNDVAQTFDSESDAKEHLEGVIALRKKEGYTIASVEEASASDVAAAEDADDTFEVVPNREGLRPRAIEAAAARAPRHLARVGRRARPGSDRRAARCRCPASPRSVRRRNGRTRARSSTRSRLAACRSTGASSGSVAPLDADEILSIVEKHAAALRSLEALDLDLADEMTSTRRRRSARSSPTCAPPTTRGA